MVATSEQVREMLRKGLSYADAGQALGIPAGQAYLIATGQPADGGDTTSEQQRRRGGVIASSQHLANPPPVNPTSSESVKKWMAGRAAADAQMMAAAEERDAVPPEPADPESDVDVTVVLTRQHNQVRVLQEQLQAVPSHTSGGTQSDVAQRKSIVDLITVYLSGHETAEEEHFWPAVREALPDGDAWAETALEQEQEGKDLLTELGRLEPDTGEFDEHAQKLVLALRRHVAHEEQVFLRLREAVPQKERERLGRKIMKAGTLAPTRPHRRSPKKPGAAVKAAAPGAAAMDKARDIAGERPADRRGQGE